MLVPAKTAFEIVLIVICLPCLLSCYACTPTPRSLNGVTLAIESGPAPSLDPRVGTSAEAERIGQLLFNSLVRRGPEFEILPDLATRWEMPEPTLYRFSLRPGVRFHNGKRLTSRDVKYTLESLLDGSITSAKTSAYGVIKNIETPDEWTVVFRLKEPYASFLWNLTNGAIGIVPEGSKSDFGRNLVGTGPFRFVSYSHEEEVVVETNPEYFGKEPNIGRAIFKIIPDATTRALELRKGSVDVGQNVLSPDFVRALEKEPHLRVQSCPGTNYAYIGLNLQDPVLKDRRVRQAIAYAIDREAIVKYYWRDLVSLASGILPPSHWAYEGQVATYTHDPTKARQLLDEAGLNDPDGDGPLPRFKLTFKTSNEETARQVAAIIQQQLKQVGVQVDLRSYEFGTFYGDIVRGNFQMFTLRWIGGNNDPDIFERVFHSREVPPKGFNRGRYHNERVDRLIEFAKREADEGRRKAAYSEIQKILAEELPYVSLWYFKTVSVYRERISNLTLSPVGDFEFLREIRWGAGGEGTVSSRQ
jgi:peptide/nickel transport system substrate-binding protein